MNNTSYPWLKNYDHGVPQDIFADAHPVYSMLDDTAKTFPEHKAFDFLGKTYTWAQIADLSHRFAAGLQIHGVTKGTHVGLFLPNCPYYLIAYYGVLKAGGVVVNLNPLYAERELAHLIEDSETDIVVTLDLRLMQDKMQKILRDTRLNNMIVCRFAAALPFPKNILFRTLKHFEIAAIPENEHLLWFDDVIKNDGRYTVPAIDPLNDLAVLQYTGGTTGIPKGAMLTHANIYSNTIQCVSWFPGLEKGAHKMLAVLPFFHVFAMTAIMNFSVLNGFEIIATPRFGLEDTLKIIDKKKPHFFPAVPAIYSAINNHPKLERYDLSSLEYCISGGAPLPVEVKKNFEALSGCTVVEGYGLSESSPVVCINPAKGQNVAGAIGLPIPSTIVELVDLENKTTLVPHGKKGELCVRGPQVMKGYWKKPQETADTLKDGRLHTGDIAVMDKSGYFFIVDRLKDMIITNGYNVYPRNVEEAIYMHPCVEECIVAGLPDGRRGEIVKAWIKLKDGRSLSEDELKGFLKDKISKMENPKRFEFRDDPLPKTMIGKLSRKDIVAQELEK
jgi:long-chain acyl-CoA synthetase